MDSALIFVHHFWGVDDGVTESKVIGALIVPVSGLRVVVGKSAIISPGVGSGPFMSLKW